MIPDGKAIVYCQGAFNTPNGKTAHGLVRFTERYHVLSVIDAVYAGKDSGEVLDGKTNNIPVFQDLLSAIGYSRNKQQPANYLVIGIAPDGGRLSPKVRNDIIKALEMGLNVDCGLHDFLSDDPEMVKAARKSGALIRDIRKTPGRKKLHFFTGNIEKVSCLKLAVLGTDSAVGKRTTAWMMVHSLRKCGYKAEMIGTGQTAWMQGAKYGLIIDSIINDFVSGEIENAVYGAWKNESPDVLVIEGQGSLMNPAYPGGFEILAAGRPDFIILQHAPRRIEYDGFPGYNIQPLAQQIHAIEVISGKKIIAITINHEGMQTDDIIPVCEAIGREVNLPCYDVLYQGAEELVQLLKNKKLM